MKRMACDTLIIGSGPGGAMTGALLAEAGVDVVLAEEGDRLSVDSSPDHSLAQMDEKWRSGGLTAALGSPKVTYIEGRCVGGASESNAGLYHPPIDDVLQGWAKRYQISNFGAEELAPHLERVVQEIGVSKRPDGFSPASDRLAEGAEKMGWKWTEIERFWRYDGTGSGQRRSMSETLVPRAVEAGARLEPNTRIDKILRKGDRAIGATGLSQGEAVHIDCKRVVVSAGAVQTPRLLRKSGFKHVGNGLTLNPMVRIVARFPDTVNVPSFGVPVVQIEEFKPQLTLGCSYSAPPHLAMWLEGSARDIRENLEAWQHMAVFYVKVCGQGSGTVRTTPVFGDALVRYRTHADDFDMMGLGLERLAQALFASGASEVHSPLPGVPPLRSAKNAHHLRHALTPQNSSLSAIHLHSTVRMGENEQLCGADSFGKLYGASNIWVNDSSLLPTSPGVNPQGTILAIARRNVQRWLDDR
jgi:choline dehydrogenase-like flavoprotein